MTSKTVAALVTRALDVYVGTKTQSEIARAAGFNSPGMLSMIKTGKVKISMAKVRGLSRELDIPFEELFVAASTEDCPDPARNPVGILFGGRMPTAAEVAAISG